MDKQEIFNKMIEFECEAGEDFFDQGFDLHPLTFMSWCLGRGYLTPEQYNLWAYDYRFDKLSSAHEPNDFVYDSDCLDVPYALFSESEWTEEGREKAYLIVAEFISEITVYQERLVEFLK